MTGSNALIREYQYGRDLVSMRTGGAAYYYHLDGLGSVVNVTSASGATQWTYDYFPFGATRTATRNASKAPVNVLAFTGQLLDPTGLYHLRARQYDPGTGRFTATDPAAAGPTDPYVSAYAYVNGNPVRFVDPSGQCIGQILTGAATGGAVGSAPGAAGGALVGFALCLAGLAVAAVAVIVADAILETRGDPTAVSRDVILEAPYIGSPSDPNTGDPMGFNCGASMGCKVVAVLLAGGPLVWYVLSNEGEAGPYLTDPRGQAPKRSAPGE